MTDQGFPPGSSQNGMVDSGGDGGDPPCDVCGDFHEMCDDCGMELDCDGECIDCDYPGDEDDEDTEDDDEHAS